MAQFGLHRALPVAASMSGRCEMTGDKLLPSSRVEMSAVRRTLRGNQRLQKQASSLHAPQPPPPSSPDPSYAPDGHRQMTAEEAQNHMRNNLQVPADGCLPAGWVPNTVNVPVALPLTGMPRLDYINLVW